MIKKKLSKLIGIKKELFDYFIESSQIKVQSAKLIPTLKTGDEMALTSIFLSSLRLIDEFKEGIFKDIKLSRTGKLYFFTEVIFPQISSSRVDGMIINVTSGKIKEVAFFEMKSKNNCIDKNQIETYFQIAKKLGVRTMVTVSNEFVSDPTHSPINLRIPKSIALYHLSWTYLLTRGQLLLFKNDYNIKDEDQVEIMREVLCYFESPLSGVLGFMRMKPGWKEVCESVKAGKKLKMTDSNVEEAVLSWHEEEKDLALLLSRKLGVLVKSTPKKPDSLKADIKKLADAHQLQGSLSVKNSVSDIKLELDFERRTVSMSVKITPPLNKGTLARNTWITKQLETCSKKSERAFDYVSKNIWVEGDVKFARQNIKIKFSELEDLNELSKGKEIQAYKIIYILDFGTSFPSVKKFIVLLDRMVLDYYEGIVQNMTNWNKPAPKLERD